MTETLLAGSAAAAFAGGLVAFFAPCCSGVMVPTYLAAVGGGSGFRTARLTALYVAGVAVVVWPITLGASALSSLIGRWHNLLFLLGGLMMLAVAAALWRGSMLPMWLPQPRLTGSALSVFSLGAFSGAATACCAPVLAGAIALSISSGEWWGGLFLGGAYILGLVVPLLPISFVVAHARKRVRDPRLTLRLAGYEKRLTLSRLAGAVVFAGFGVLFVTLALTGNAEATPGFQVTIARWMRAVALALVYLVIRPKGEPR